MKTCWYPCKAPGCGQKLYLNSRGQTPLSLKANAKALALDGDDDGSMGGGQPDQSSSSSGLAVAPTTCQGEGRKRMRGKQTPDTVCRAPEQPRGKNCCETGPDVDIDSAWFAARKHSRIDSGEEELASLI